MLAAKEETTPIGGAVSLSAETRVWGLPPGNRNGAGGCWPVTSTLHWGWSQFYAGTASGQLDQRYYNPQQGRFSSPDVHVAKSALRSPQNWNRYAYAGDDPVNRVDPSGNDWCVLYEADNQGCSVGDPGTGGGDGAGGGDGGSCPAGEQLMSTGQCSGGDGSGGGSGGDPPGQKPDCNAITAGVGFAGLTYSNALEIWNDGSLSTYQTDSAAATIAALAAVTWQGENSFQTGSINHLNPNGTVDIGPFQLNYSTWKAVAPKNVFGTNVSAGQSFNGSVSANIAFAITFLESLFSRYGDNAAGAYVAGHVPKGGFSGHAAEREQTWTGNETKLQALFQNTDCFHHQ